MKYEKIVCWADAEMQKRISSEFTNTNIISALSFDDFMKNITDNSLNIISASQFDDFDTSGFVYEVKNTFKSQSEKTFHIFMYMEKDNAPLSCGLLAQEKNVIDHLIFPDYKGTIQTRIDAEL